jgi:hypothetical protein
MYTAILDVTTNERFRLGIPGAPESVTRFSYDFFLYDVEQQEFLNRKPEG